MENINWEEYRPLMNITVFVVDQKIVGMSRFEEKVRIKQLLVDAITLLCRNGMQFENKFCIEALIAITLDDRDVVLVNINETIDNPESGSTGARPEPSENASKSVKTRTKTVKKEASREDIAQSSEDPLTNFDSNSYYDHGNFVGLNSSAYNSSDDQNSSHNIKYEELDEGNNYDRPNNDDEVQANLVSEDGTNADDCYFVKSETLDENADNQGWSNMNADPAYNSIEHNVLNPPNAYFYQAAPHRKSKVREKSVISKSNWRSSTARIGRPRYSSTVLQDQV